LSKRELIDLSEFAYKTKSVQQAKGTVHRIEILRALPAEKTITLVGAGK
jgi:hypothetical protein